MIDVLRTVSQELPVLFFAHPQTTKRIKDYGLEGLFLYQGSAEKELSRGIHILHPLGYIEFIAHVSHATVVLTDSGGIQEETTFLGIPCITLRTNTERPVTVDVGTNIIAGHDVNIVARHIRRVLEGSHKKGQIPELWDGKTSARIADIILDG
jgi:UDP-N-acetylglucosamine 2-epimerase (non-hydrolysing)